MRMTRVLANAHETVCLRRAVECGGCEWIGPLCDQAAHQMKCKPRQRHMIASAERAHLIAAASSSRSRSSSNSQKNNNSDGKLHVHQGSARSVNSPILLL
jgi:hypothetical protein